MNRFSCCALLFLIGGMVSAAAEEMVVRVSVRVDPIKSNGSPWDGVPSFGTGRILVPAESNAPDIAVCIVFAAGAPDCHWRSVGNRKLSFCQNATRCAIDWVRLPRLPAGLLFLDVDLVRHDLIDFVILTDDTASAGDVEKVELNLRGVMANLTPGITDTERRRRLRKPAMLPLEQCLGASAKCDLDQSVFNLERR